MFCEARKNLSINRVHFDLTKDRSTLYQKTRDLKMSKKYIIYVHIDVNCRLKVKFELMTDEESSPGVLEHGAQGTNVDGSL